MKKTAIFLGDTPLQAQEKKVEGGFMELEGELFYRIGNFDGMDEFFMTIVSPSDHWMYLSSSGSLSAGRINRNHAFFPYYTVDKIHDYKEITGPRTWLLIEQEDKMHLWEPFTESSRRVYKVKRSLYKSMYGNKVLFEEHNQDLGLTFRYGWYNSDAYGWIRKSSLTNHGGAEKKLRFLDGLCNLLPYGADYAFQTEFSNLMDAYKKNELLENSKLGLYMLSSIPVDRAEPSEALKATSVWSYGLEDGAKILLSERQVGAFLRGNDLETEINVRAARGAYLMQEDLLLKAGASKEWGMVVEINQDATQVANLNAFLLGEKNPAAMLDQDIQKGSRELIRVVASADGLQLGREKLGYARHFSNALYNIMRGGVYTDNYQVGRGDLLDYIAQSNRTVLTDHRSELETLPEKLDYQELIRWVRSAERPHLERLCLEYLPLTFSRRHGDPSRPWNQFSIEIKNEDGSNKLNYQGNWRDIFQNWEALNLSFPAFQEGILHKFLNASTVDGYNPYRITRDGVDWEAPDPDDPWAYIGYWGDHQIIYLQKFLEQARDFYPGQLEALLDRELFVFTDVPYRIKPFEELVRNPKDTIEFDHELNAQIEQRAEDIGADGRLRYRKDGQLERANLTEKILVTLLAKLSNFIPEAGIWLNTQRPEWNDANNALVGSGVSMVTLYYMRRFLAFWHEVFDGLPEKEIGISKEIHTHLGATRDAFGAFEHLLEDGFSDRQRYQLTRKLGEAGSNFRSVVYEASLSERKSRLGSGELKEFCALVLRFVDQSIAKNRREDGLYHSYNLLSFGDEEIRIRTLYEMLEGQVAVLSSGLLKAKESLEVLDALKASKMFREDQYSYMLYPNRDLPRFEHKNNITEEQLKKIPLLQKLVDEHDTSILSVDVQGRGHFNGSFRNGNALSQALDQLDEKRYGEHLDSDRGAILALYESIFDHQSFTGRSGTFFGYEGLGSIYWHMVSKLLLAVEECFFLALKEGDQDAALNRLKAHYYEIKAGIGIYKSPELYGAFPTDAYSHTPAHSGAKQPGLTGQVKEDLISRLCELGLQVSNGEIHFDPALLNQDEVLDQEEEFHFVDLKGHGGALSLKQGQWAFTFCQIPVLCSYGDEDQAVIHLQDGSRQAHAGTYLPQEVSRRIFARDPEIHRIEFVSTR